VADTTSAEVVDEGDSLRGRYTSCNIPVSNALAADQRERHPVLEKSLAAR
jgi:hypothetical protein